MPVSVSEPVVVSVDVPEVGELSGTFTRPGSGCVEGLVSVSVTVSAPDPVPVPAVVPVPSRSSTFVPAWARSRSRSRRRDGV